VQVALRGITGRAVAQMVLRLIRPRGRVYRAQIFQATLHILLTMLHIQQPTALSYAIRDTKKTEREQAVFFQHVQLHPTATQLSLEVQDRVHTPAMLDTQVHQPKHSHTLVVHAQQAHIRWLGTPYAQHAQQAPLAAPQPNLPALRVQLVLLRWPEALYAQRVRQAPTVGLHPSQLAPRVQLVPTAAPLHNLLAQRAPPLVF